MSYFSMLRDRQIIEAGGFFCHADLSAHPTEQQSPDPRYCQGCYDLLLNEAEMLPSNRRPSWIPRATPQDTPEPLATAVQRARDGGKITKGISDGVPILSPMNSNKRGRKPVELPLDYIDQLTKEGFGCKKIAARLKSEGIECSYRTLARRKIQIGGR